LITTPLISLALLGFAAPPTVPPVAAATVVKFVDGDTVDVSIDGQIETIRLIGIDADEAGTPCGDAVIAFAAEALPVGAPVVLTSGAVDERDVFGRLLRYISFANPNDNPDVVGDETVDLGGYLLGGGLVIPRYDSTDGYGEHPLETAYYAITAEPFLPECQPGFTEVQQAVAQAPAPEPAPEPAAAQPERGCDPNYTGCVPIDSDVDCAGGSGNGPSYTGRVEVIGVDIYDLDRDGDGVACE
jgi:endonuclease YncB( thermonuclease family)